LRDRDGIRDMNGKFVPQQELKYRRTSKGRRKVGLCNCCKTNTIPRNRFYCDNCRSWVQSVKSRQQLKLQTMKSKVQKYLEIFEGSNPGNVMQMLGSFKRYKSSSDHYRKKCEVILKAYNELLEQSAMGEAFVFKMQSNSVALQTQENPIRQGRILESPMVCEVPNY